MNTSDNLNITILKQIGAGKNITNKIYDECPRYILFLYEKYKELGLTIMLSNHVLFLAKKRRGTNDLYDVITCYHYSPEYLRQFKNTVLSREEVFFRIKEIKRKCKS